MPCFPANGDNCFATGTVRRIYARDAGAYIRLNIPVPNNNQPGDDQGPDDDTPGGEGYFRLLRGHPNYNALYSLLLVAFTNRKNLTIRTENPIDPNSSRDAEVFYLVVDW